jgi:hypothetical protein
MEKLLGEIDDACAAFKSKVQTMLEMSILQDANDVEQFHLILQ